MNTQSTIKPAPAVIALLIACCFFAWLTSGNNADQTANRANRIDRAIADYGNAPKRTVAIEKETAARAHDAVMTVPNHLQRRSRLMT